MTTLFQAVERDLRAIMSSKDCDRMFVLTDTNVARLLPVDFLQGEPRLEVAPGEESKSLEGAVQVWNFLEKEGATRRSLLVNVGGGMVSDLGGFAASTFKRGIRCVNLPTTLLAAVDAAIGGKTGINFSGLKNEIGTFSLPLAVIPLVDLFDTIPEEEWLSGVGEAIKTGLLAGGELLKLAASPKFILRTDKKIVEKVTKECAAFKNKVVEEDFRESGRRKILNLGHTAGHAIEALNMKRGEHIAHGIAVAHGIGIALRKSVEECGAEPSLATWYEEVLQRYFPPLALTEADLAEMEQYMARDKKNRELGKPAWVLLRAPGQPVITGGDSPAHQAV